MNYFFCIKTLMWYYTSILYILSQVFKEKLSFRQKAEARTDTHGIGMYANLPEEFQEIARRLARQDSQLKKQEFQRGRSTSRSRTSSRHSSASPNTRGRSRTRQNKRLTPGSSISDIYADVNSTKVWFFFFLHIIVMLCFFFSSNNDFSTSYLSLKITLISGFVQN